MLRKVVVALSYLLVIPSLCLAVAPTPIPSPNLNNGKFVSFYDDQALGDYTQIMVQKSNKTYQVVFQQYVGQKFSHELKIVAKKGSLEDATIQNCLTLAAAAKSGNRELWIMNDTADKNGLVCTIR